MYADSMEGVCDTDNLLLEISTSEDCAETQEAANTVLMYGVGLAFLGIICIILAVLTFLGVILSSSSSPKQEN